MEKELHIERYKGVRVKLPLSSCFVEILEDKGFDLRNKARFKEILEDGKIIIEFYKKEEK